MGHRLNNLEALAQLRKQVPDTSIIDKVSPLFIPGRVASPQRSTYIDAHSQLFWEQQGERRYEHERLCLTLGLDGLTIAIGHRHDGETIPSISERHSFVTASMYVTSEHHRLTVTNQARREQHLVNREAAKEFLPRLDHTLGVLGLGQQATRSTYFRRAS